MQLVRRGTFKTLTFKAIVLYINLVAVFGKHPQHQHYPPPFFPPPLLSWLIAACRWLNHTGRLVWLIDPEDFNDLLNSAVRALLLRFPQTLQLVQVLLYIFLWYKLRTRTHIREHRTDMATPRVVMLSQEARWRCLCKQ